MSQSPAQKHARPLSPHLQIYKPQMTSVLSILHRMTGAALAVGTLLVAAVLVCAAIGEDAYTTMSHYVKSTLGQFMLFGWSAALYFHMFNGIRHLFWDAGRLLELKKAYAAGYAVLALTTVATLATWCYAYGF